MQRISPVAAFLALAVLSGPAWAQSAQPQSVLPQSAAAPQQLPPGVEYQPVKNPELAQRMLNQVFSAGFEKIHSIDRKGDSYIIQATHQGELKTIRLDLNSGRTTVQ